MAASGSEHSFLEPELLKELRAGGDSSPGTNRVTAPASVHTEAEIEEMRERAAARVANPEDVAEHYGEGGEHYGAYLMAGGAAK